MAAAFVSCRRIVQTLGAGAIVVALMGAPHGWDSGFGIWDSASTVFRCSEATTRTTPASAIPSPEPAPAAPKRSLVPLYISFATLQALDIESTVRVIEGGGREANPIVAGVWQSPAGVTALKAGATAGLIFAAQRLKKGNPKAALVLMVAANSAMATIVAHNFAIAR